MGYYNDAEKQFNEIIKDVKNQGIEKLYPRETQDIFCGIFMINYIANRIEFRDTFNSNYFNIALSCLIESFSLILNNYTRGSALVLRSSLENFVKFIIESTGDNRYAINDRSYTPNKSTLDKIIKGNYIESLKSESLSLNSKMEAEYGKLSALSHSLTAESKSNVISYFIDINNINEENANNVIITFLKIINQIFSFSVIICQPSFKLWDSHDFKKILKMVFGERKATTFMAMIKS